MTKRLNAREWRGGRTAQHNNTKNTRNQHSVGCSVRQRGKIKGKQGTRATLFREGDGKGGGGTEQTKTLRAKALDTPRGGTKASTNA